MKAIRMIQMFILFFSVQTTLFVYGGNEGVIHYRSLHAEDGVVQMALDTKLRNTEMDETEDENENQMLAMGKIVFQLTQEDLKKAALEADLEEQLEITEGSVLFAPNRMRHDGMSEGQKVSSIMLVDKNIIQNVFWARKAYTEMDLNQMKKQFEAMAKQMQDAMKNMEMYEADANAPGQTEAKLIKTGRQQTIHGYRCTEVIAYDEQEVVVAWMTQDTELKKVMEEWQTYMADYESEEEGVGKLIEELDGIAILEKSYDGFSLQIEELVRLEKKSVDKSSFVIPAGFQKMSMQDMMVR